MPDVSVRTRLRSWAYALRTTNPPPDGPVDVVTRWLVVTRAAVLPPSFLAQREVRVGSTSRAADASQ